LSRLPSLELPPAKQAVVVVVVVVEEEEEEEEEEDLYNSSGQPILPICLTYDLPS
jgi:hypothetical protein